MSTRLRIGVCGYGQHGKETTSKWLRDRLGLRYVKSTSQAAAELVFNVLREEYDYESVEQCFEDRRNHRTEWAEIIWKYNEPDGIRLYEDMLEENDILDGIRKQYELNACRERRMLDFTLWVDASGRKPPEPISCEVGPADCDVVIDNNGTVDDLHRNLEAWLTSFTSLPMSEDNRPRPHVGALCVCSRGCWGHITESEPREVTYYDGTSAVAWIGVHAQDRPDLHIKAGEPWCSRNPTVRVDKHGVLYP